MLIQNKCNKSLGLHRCKMFYILSVDIRNLNGDKDTLKVLLNNFLAKIPEEPGFSLQPINNRTYKN